jgi:hypothetical protein
MNTKLNDRICSHQNRLTTLANDLEIAGYTTCSTVWRDNELFKQVRDLIRQIQVLESHTKVCYFFLRLLGNC